MKSKPQGTLYPRPLDPREIRRRCGLSQQQFWSQIGVTQSGGSRYESGRRMPRPVQELLRVVYVEGIDLTAINRSDFDVLNKLKRNNPDLYAGLKAEAALETAAADDTAPHGEPASFPIHVDYERLQARGSGSAWNEHYAAPAMAASNAQAE